MDADIPQRQGEISFQQRSAKGKWVEDIVMGNVEDDFSVVEVIRTDKVPPIWTRPQQSTQQPPPVIYANSTMTSGASKFNFNPFIHHDFFSHPDVEISDLKGKAQFPAC
jgi:hypothetical protein